MASRALGGSQASPEMDRPNRNQGRQWQNRFESERSNSRNSGAQCAGHAILRALRVLRGRKRIMNHRVPSAAFGRNRTRHRDLEVPFLRSRGGIERQSRYRLRYYPDKRKPARRMGSKAFTQIGVHQCSSVVLRFFSSGSFAVRKRNMENHGAA